MVIGTVSVWKKKLSTFLQLSYYVLFLFQSYSLFSLGHPSWGLLTLLFPLLAAGAAAASVLLGRCRRGWSRSSPMPPRKALALALRALATVCEGLFESGPELVLQSVVLFHGVHIEDFKVRWN